MAISEDAVHEALKNVIDPELFVNIVDLGLIYAVNVAEEKEDTQVRLAIALRHTRPFCAGRDEWRPGICCGSRG